jgi:hypothetical protein
MGPNENRRLAGEWGCDRLEDGLPELQNGGAAVSTPEPEDTFKGDHMRSGSRFAALLLIVLGVLFLLGNLGVIPRLGPLLAQWWPAILIVIGVAMLVRKA